MLDEPSKLVEIDVVLVENILVLKVVDTIDVGTDVNATVVNVVVVVGGRTRN